MAPHVADITGNGLVNALDEAVVRNALYTVRGSGLRPAAAFDLRADIFGRGVVDSATLTAVRRAVRDLAGRPEAAARRPITIAWHYGWYNYARRQRSDQTVGFKGGDYASWDPQVESLFNELKNEFGITVDALSWIPFSANPAILENYRRGFLSAQGLETRHVALLYESTIALPIAAEARIDFFDTLVATRLVAHFEQMAEFLREVKDQAGGRLLLLDGRPVVFIFGSHIWGLVRDGLAQLGALDAVFDRARSAFARSFGRPPFVVGEEMFLSASGPLSADRRHRASSFDAVFIYHHASNLKPIALSGREHVVLDLTESYVDNQLGILTSTYDAVSDITNRYTGRPILVIPNLSPGFAKPGLPTLRVTRRPYAEFMKRLEQRHLDQHLSAAWAPYVGTSVLPAPLYVVGSWNEEFEGHAVFPASFNDSVGRFEQDGFDLAMAIKEVFSWNHYAERALPG